MTKYDKSMSGTNIKSMVLVHCGTASASTFNVVIIISNHMCIPFMYVSFFSRHVTQGLSEMSALCECPPITANTDAAELFDAVRWKPGFLNDGRVIVAVKGKRVVHTDKMETLRANGGVPSFVNVNTPTHLYAFKDSPRDNPNTAAAFATTCQEQSPVRVSWFDETRACMVD